MFTNTSTPFAENLYFIALLFILAAIALSTLIVLLSRRKFLLSAILTLPVLLSMLVTENSYAPSFLIGVSWVFSVVGFCTVMGWFLVQKKMWRSYLGLASTMAALAILGWAMSLQPRSGMFAHLGWVLGSAFICLPALIGLIIGRFLLAYLKR